MQREPAKRKKKFKKSNLVLKFVTLKLVRSKKYRKQKAVEKIVRSKKNKMVKIQHADNYP